ncbi:MAG: hypothetical protein AAGA72_02850 [Pseudomonadota bacterium]
MRVTARQQHKKTMPQREFQLILAGDSVFKLDVMSYGSRQADLTPLLILHSIEFPIPPSVAFCEYMRTHGYQVIFVRRAGYGRSTPLPDALFQNTAVKSGATVAAEAAMLRQLIARLDVSRIVLLALGSANPVASRLIHMTTNIDVVIFANPVFNREIWQVFSPEWFAKMIKQIVTSQSGLEFAMRGMKLMIRNNPVGFYQSILQKDRGDLDYVTQNAADYCDAGNMVLDVTPGQLYYEANSVLAHDHILKDRYFANTNAAVLIGAKTKEHWRLTMKAEASRLQLPLIQAPIGDIFCAYASPDTLLEAIRQFASQNTISVA